PTLIVSSPAAKAPGRALRLPSTPAPTAASDEDLRNSRRLEAGNCEAGWFIVSFSVRNNCDFGFRNWDFGFWNVAVTRVRSPVLIRLGRGKLDIWTVQRAHDPESDE